MNFPALKRNASPQAGFSLVELAVALMIIGTLMSGVLVAVSQSVTNSRITDAKAQLREIEEALYGFAQANGRLPCPATDDSTVASFEENPCDDQHGFVPSGTLGLRGQLNDAGLMVDPWGNPLRYSVVIDTTSSTNPNYTNAASIKNFFDNGAAIANNDMFEVCDSGCATPASDVVPAVVMSLGANWSSFTSADESTNAGTATMSGYSIKNDTTFISDTYSEENFDDQLVWLSPFVLINRLVEAGKLP